MLNRPNFFKPLSLCLGLCFAFGLVGCGESGSTGTSATATPLPASLFVDSAPDGAQAISELKTTAKEGDEVVVRVVVGGSANPIVPGRASASIVDAGLYNKCLSEDDHCQVPWDYCCAPPEDLNPSMANLQILGEDGRVLPADLNAQLPPLANLVVRGTVGPRPDEQVLTINATSIYIESTP